MFWKIELRKSPRRQSSRENRRAKERKEEKRENKKKKKGANKEFQKERELSKRKERNYQSKQEHFPELVRVCLQRAHITPQTRKSISPPRHIILKFQKTEAGQKFDMLPGVKSRLHTNVAL